jgi:hypothetical protein
LFACLINKPYLSYPDTFVDPDVILANITTSEIELLSYYLPKSSDKKCHSALDAESSSLMIWIPAFAGMTKLLVLAKLSLDLEFTYLLNYLLTH